jgi:hypothetical protein
MPAAVCVLGGLGFSRDYRTQKDHKQNHSNKYQYLLLGPLLFPEKPPAKFL